MLRNIGLGLVDQGLERTKFHGGGRTPQTMDAKNDGGVLWEDDDLPRLLATIFHVCISMCDASDLALITSLYAIADLGRDMMFHCDNETLYKKRPTGNVHASSSTTTHEKVGSAASHPMDDDNHLHDAGGGGGADDDDGSCMEDMSTTTLLVVKKKKRKQEHEDGAADPKKREEPHEIASAPTSFVVEPPPPPQPPQASWREESSWCDQPFCGEDRWCKDSTFVLNKTEALPIFLQLFSSKAKTLMSGQSSHCYSATALEHSEDLVEYLARMNAQMLALRLCMIEDMLSEFPVDIDDAPEDEMMCTIDENDENDNMPHHHNVSQNSSQNSSYHIAVANSMRVSKILSDLLGRHFSSKSQHVDHCLLLGYLLSLPEEEGFSIYKDALLRLQTSIVTSSKTSMPVVIHYEKLFAIARLGVDVGVAWNEPAFVHKCLSLSQNSWWFRQLASAGIAFDHKLLLDSQHQLTGNVNVGGGGGGPGSSKESKPFKSPPVLLLGSKDNYAKSLIPKWLEKYTSSQMLTRDEFALLLDFCRHFHVDASAPAYLSMERCLLAHHEEGRCVSLEHVSHVISWASPLVPLAQLYHLVDNVLQQLDPSDYQRIHFVYTMLRRREKEDTTTTTTTNTEHNVPESSSSNSSAFVMIPRERATLHEYCQLLHCLEAFHAALHRSNAVAAKRAAVTGSPTTEAMMNDGSGSGGAVASRSKMNFFTLVHLTKEKKQYMSESVTNSPWDEIQAHLTLPNEECRVLLRQIASFPCVNICPDELELRLLKESMAALCSGKGACDEDRHTQRHMFDCYMKPPLSRMKRGKFVMEALMWLKELTSQDTWLIKLKLDAVDFALDNMSSLFPQKSAAVDQFRHVLRVERRKVATAWILKNVAFEGTTTLLYDASFKLQELTVDSKSVEDGKAIIYELYYTYYAMDKKATLLSGGAKEKTATATTASLHHPTLSVHDAVNQLCGIYNVNGPEVRQDIVHKWLLEEPLFIDGNTNGSGNVLRGTCFCASSAELREQSEQTMIARIIDVLNYTEDVPVANPLDSVLDTPGTRGTAAASRRELVGEKYVDRCKYLSNVAMQARSVKIKWHSRKRAIRILFQYAPWHVIQNAIGECQFQSLKNGFWLECCYRALFEELDLPQPSDEMTQSVVQGLVKSLWRDHRNDPAVVRVLSLVLLDFQVEEPQLWLSVLWSLLESGMARHLLFCLLEQLNQQYPALFNALSDLGEEQFVTGPSGFVSFWHRVRRSLSP
jgi:hypothetical protein